MQVRIERVGNALALRLPAELVAELSLCEGTTVDIVAAAGPTLRIGASDAKVRTTRDLLAELVAQAKPENEPDLVDWGPDRGSEIIDDAYSRGEITLDDILSGRVARGG